MTNTLDKAMRPSWGRIAAIVLIGPAIGVFAMLALATLLEPNGDLSAISEYFAPALSLGWVMGLIPSVLGAIGYWLAYPRLVSTPQRVLAALCIGAIAGLIGIWPAIWMLFGVMRADLQFSLMAAAAGAIALLITAIPFAQKKP